MSDSPSDFAELVERCTARFERDRELRLELRNEIETHLLAAASEYAASDYSAAEARAEAMRNFGDPDTVAGGLWAANRWRFSLRFWGQWAVRLLILPGLMLVVGGYIYVTVGDLMISARPASLVPAGVAVVGSLLVVVVTCRAARDRARELGWNAGWWSPAMLRSAARALAAATLLVGLVCGPWLVGAGRALARDIAAMGPLLIDQEVNRSGIRGVRDRLAGGLGAPPRREGPDRTDPSAWAAWAERGDRAGR